MISSPMAVIRKWTICALALILFTGCSTDPNKRKVNYLRAGEAYIKSGKYQEAIIEFRNAIEIDPRFASAHYQLGNAYLAVNNPDAAARELTETVTLEPSNSQAQLQLAALLLNRGQLDQAQSTAQKVLATEPGNARAHAILAENLTLKRDFAGAIREFQQAVKLEPQRIENYGALGAAFRAAGRLPEAEDAYWKAVQMNPKSSPAQVALGQFYFSVGKLAQAETAMRTACDLDAQAIPPRIFLARIYQTTNRMAEAENLYRSLKAIASTDPHAYQTLGTFYLSSGNKEKAAAEFQSLLQAHPKDNSTRAYLAETLLDLKRTAEVEPLLEEILRANPADPRGLLSQGRLLLAQANYNKSVEVLQKAVKAAPDSANASYFLGVAQQAAGFPDAAKSSYSRALALQPQMPAAAGALATLAARSGDYTEASRQAGIARQIDPNLPSANIAGAQALIAKGDLRGAETTLQALLDRDPASVPALSALLSVSIRQGRAQEIVHRLTGLISQYPQNAGLHFLLGLAYFQLKDYTRSESSVRAALRLNPQTPDAETLLANIAFAKGSVEEAKSHLRAAIAAFPRNLMNYTALITQYEKEGNWTEATRLCETAHQIDPSSPFVAAELAFLYLEHGGDVNAAVALAQAARQKMPDSPVTADALGWAYYKLGSFASAVEQLKESSEKVPSNPIYHYHLGMAYVGARQFDQARQSLLAALRADPHFPYAANAQAALAQISRGVH